MTRAPLPPAPRPPPRQRRIQEVRAPPTQVRCRDTTIHNTFMYGDMKGVYAVLKDPAMVNALMETVHEEMAWAPEMGMTSQTSRRLVTKVVKKLLSASTRHVDAELQREADVGSASGCRSGTLGLRGGAAVPWSRGQRRPRRSHRPPRRLRGLSSCLRPAAAGPRGGPRTAGGRRQRSSSPLHLRPVIPVSGTLFYLIHYNSKNTLNREIQDKRHKGAIN